MLQGHEPVRAYDVLDRLKDERSGAAPPTVYRALDFLLEQGLVHRIESMNAFVGCGLAGRVHSGQFLICDSCGRVAELNDRNSADRLAAVAASAGSSSSARWWNCTGCVPAVRHRRMRRQVRHDRGRPSSCGSDCRHGRSDAAGRHSRVGDRARWPPPAGWHRPGHRAGADHQPDRPQWRGQIDPGQSGPGADRT
ncbi:transcriptional repressor [Tistrella bauzanensis]